MIDEKTMKSTRTSQNIITLERINYRGRLVSRGRTIRVRNSDAKKYIERGHAMPLPEPNFKDVFKLDFKLPETVTILGSGPNGKTAYPRIKKSDFVICLNGAIGCPVRSDLWMAMDPTLPRQRYFIEAMRDHYKEHYHKGLDLSEKSIGKGYPIPVMEKMRIARKFPWVQLTFNLKLGTYREFMMKPDDVEPIPGCVRPGATVAACAVQFCQQKGVKHIRLCGIDMFGAVYFDKSRHRKMNRKDSMWSVVPVFNALMRYMEGHGMSFTTLSKTQLNIKSE